MTIEYPPLFPGISATAARRLARVAGDYAAMSEQERLAFTHQLRERRAKGAKLLAVKKEDLEGNGDEQQEREADINGGAEGASQEGLAEAPEDDGGG